MAVDPKMQLSRRLVPGIQPDEAQALLDRMTRVSRAPGEVMLTEGEQSDALYFVSTGRLRVTVTGPSGELTLAEVEPEHWVGEVGLIDGGDASATVLAAEDSVLYRLANEELLELRVAEPRLATALLRTLSVDLASRIRHSNDFLVAQLGGPDTTTPPVQASWLTGALSRLLWGKGGSA